MIACFYFCFCKNYAYCYQRGVLRLSLLPLLLAKEKSELYVLIKMPSRRIVKGLSAKGLVFELRMIPEGPEGLNLIQLPLSSLKS